MEHLCAHFATLPWCHVRLHQDLGLFRQADGMVSKGLIDKEGNHVDPCARKSTRPAPMDTFPKQYFCAPWLTLAWACV
jgi:hypothetical protein